MKTSKQRREQRKRAKLRMANVEVHDMFPEEDYYTTATAIQNLSQPRPSLLEQMCVDYNYFVPLAYGTCSFVVQNTKEEKDNTMNTTQNPDLVAKDYLVSRTRDVYYEKENVIPKSFGLHDDDAPRDAAETVKRIQAGKFELPNEKTLKEAARYGYGPLYAIRWRDPTVVADQVGADAAFAALRAAYNDTKDQVMVNTPVDGLAALKAFEAMSFEKTNAPTTAVTQ